jgi:hypothetical protein
VAEEILTALGGSSRITCGQIQSVRGMLSLLLDALPDYSDIGG